LQKHHSLYDVKKVANFLEEKLDTKVCQIAIHRDEGFKDENGVKKNYHAHIEFLGLDQQGKSIRRKLTKNFLRELQTETAKILGMERGQKNSKKRRLDTYEFKEHAKRKEEEKKEQLAKIKDLKEINKNLREKLQENHAQRSDYQKLENLVKDLRREIQFKNLSIENLIDKAKSFEEESILKTKKIEEIEMENFKIKRELKKYKTNQEVQQEIEHENNELKQKIETLKKQVTNEQNEQNRIKKQANLYFDKKEKEINQLRKENKKLLKQKNAYKSILKSIQEAFGIKAISSIRSRLKSIFEARTSEKQAQVQQQEQIYARRKKSRMRR
jgi:chromosome segregation ATPase